MKMTKKIVILLMLGLVIAFFAACSRTYEARVTNKSVLLPSPVLIGDVDFGEVTVGATTEYKTFDDVGPYTIKINSFPSTTTLTFNPLKAIFSSGIKKTVTVWGWDIENVSVSED
ncbi:hypothetical protein LCGC14_2690890 [marine sediment metagenome]|uniref:Uncharacterized protein n=1 Tax=marine sediment metagenome TaxID=412755 RepID=A0A0F8ZIK0_9ZZZZ